MEAFRVGEALLRSSRPFSARTAATSQTARSQRCTAARPFSSTTIPRARGDDQGPPEPKKSSSSSGNGDIGFLDSALDLNKNTPTSSDQRTSRFASRNAQRTNPPSRFQARNESLARSTSSSKAGQSSVDQVMDLLSNTSRTPRRDLGFDKPLGGRVSGALNPNRNLRAAGPTGVVAVPEPAPMKLNSSLGRTVQIDPEKGFDVARAFQVLNTQLNRNNVKRHSQRQRYHERPGLKRKRLVNERWRKNFKSGFVGMVKRAQRMAAQGW